MRYCKKCVLPETRPNLNINDDGICNACTLTIKKDKIDWDLREKLFADLVENTKKKSRPDSWDCVIPVSGGKDSTWQVIKCLEYGLKPLCVTWRTPARNKLGQANLDNLISLGVDHFDISINPEVEKKFTLKTLEKIGSPAAPMHMALFALPLNVAMKFDIPLVMWGENSASEYGGNDDATLGYEMNRAWLLKYGVTNGTTAEDWVDDDLSAKDMAPYYWPNDAQLKEKNVTAAFLGWYFYWDPVKTYEIAKNHGFKALEGKALTGFYKFADVDDEFLITIHHWLKWYKFGFTRLWDNLSLEIRNGRMTRSQAIEMIAERKNETPHEEIEKFCAWTGITKDVFFEKIVKFRNEDIWSKQGGNWKIKDFLIEGWSWD